MVTFFAPRSKPLAVEYHVFCPVTTKEKPYMPTSFPEIMLCPTTTHWRPALLPPSHSPYLLTSTVEEDINACGGCCY
ncbi:hypothetical protein E2542_SST26379 [Spatholobus suberectus]|nr:hypothetical protein E2542_SST26379 [Spatholobus suberectus]